MKTIYINKSDIVEDYKNAKLIDDRKGMADAISKADESSPVKSWRFYQHYYVIHDTEPISLDFIVEMFIEELTTFDGYNERNYQLSYVDGKITCNGLPFIQNTLLYLVRSIHKLAVRVPNLESFYDPSKDLYTIDNYLFVNIAQMDGELYRNTHLITSEMKPYLTYGITMLFENYAGGIDFAIGYEALKNRTEYLITRFYNRIFSDIKLNHAVLATFETEGWEMIGLNDMVELIELFFIENLTEDVIFFKKGIECIKIENKSNVTIFNRAGNMIDDNRKFIALGHRQDVELRCKMIETTSKIRVTSKKINFIYK